MSCFAWPGKFEKDLQGYFPSLTSAVDDLVRLDRAASLVARVALLVIQLASVNELPRSLHGELTVGRPYPQSPFVY